MAFAGKSFYRGLLNEDELMPVLWKSIDWSVGWFIGLLSDMQH